jgi:hypothetical protein
MIAIDLLVKFFVHALSYNKYSYINTYNHAT